MPISPVMPDEDPAGRTDVDAPQVPTDDGSGSGSLDQGQDEDGSNAGSLAAGSAVVAPKRATYADKYGPILGAFDQRIAANKQALQAAQQTQTLAQQHVALTKQRHAITLKAAAEANKPNGTLASAPNQVQSPSQQFALPGNNQPSHDEILHSFDDKHFEEANAAYKKKTGKSADELYDQAVEGGKIQPSDDKLTKRQKSHLFIKFGLEMLKNNQQGIATAMGNAGSATLDEYDRMKSGSAEADAAEQDRVQKIRLEQAKNAGETERTGMTQSGEDARNQKNIEKDYGVAKIAAGAKEKSAADKPQETYGVDDQGYRVRIVNGVQTPVLDKGGNKVKAQKTAEDQNREDDKKAKVDATHAKRIQDEGDKIRKDPLGARIKENGHYRAMTDDEITAKARKIVESSEGKGSDDSNPYNKWKK